MSCDLSDFIKEYQLDCPYAMDRLVKYGVPATVLHRQVDERDQIGRARQAAETVRVDCCVTRLILASNCPSMSQ